MQELGLNPDEIWGDARDRTLPSIPQSPAFIQFGMFAGNGQCTEADFEIAEFQGDTDGNCIDRA